MQSVIVTVMVLCYICICYHYFMSIISSGNCFVCTLIYAIGLPGAAGVVIVQ